jgi:hypothetical protein
MALTDRQQTILTLVAARIAHDGKPDDFRELVLEVRNDIQPFFQSAQDWIPIDSEDIPVASAGSPWKGVAWIAAEPPDWRQVWWEGNAGQFWFLTTAGGKGTAVPAPVTYLLPISPP